MAVLMRSRARSDYRLTSAVLIVGVIAFALLQSLVIPAMPTIQAAFHSTQADTSWVLTAYLLSASIFTPILGRMGDMWGKRRFVLVVLVALAAGSALSAVAGSLWVMIAGRAIQGLGGGLLPLSFGIVRDEFPPAKVATAVGVIAALTAAGSGLGLVIGGPIVETLSFRWLFWLPMIFLLLAVVACYIVVPESPVRKAGGVNWFAAGLLSVWLLALLLPVSESAQWGWGSTRVIGLLAVAVLTFVAWVVVESRSSRPLIDMRMMRIPVVWTNNLVALLLGVGMYAIFAFLPQFVQTPRSAGYGFGASVTESGLLLLPSSAATFVAGLLCGRLTLRYGGRAVLVAGTVASVIPFALLAMARESEAAIIVATFVLGAGFGVAYAAMSSLIVEGVPVDQTGVASGMNANIRTIGGSVGTAVMTSVITATAHNGGLPTNAGYTRGFVFLTVAAIGAAAASLLVPKGLKPPTPAQLDRALPHPESGMVAGATLLGDEE